MQLWWLLACSQTRMPTQTPKAPRRSESGAGDTAIPRTPRNSSAPQGWVNTQASKDDWEEINFEFNSSILTDGFPDTAVAGRFLALESRLSRDDYRPHRFCGRRALQRAAGAGARERGQGISHEVRRVTRSDHR